MISPGLAQDIEAGPIRVDSGDHATDVATAVFLVLFCAAVYVVVRRLTRQ